jgi:hypothetical protein
MATYRFAARTLRTYVWTLAQLDSASRYQTHNQMRIVHQLRETLEDRYICLVDCDERTGVLLHLL